MQLLNSIWRAGFKYSKAGVMLSDFYYNDARQLDMFNVVPDDRRSRSLMTVIDKINHSGKGSVFFARQGIQNCWKMQRTALSPKYTTRWNDIPIVR